MNSVLSCIEATTKEIAICVCSYEEKTHTTCVCSNLFFKKFLKCWKFKQTTA